MHFAFVITLSAFLIFLVQPLIAKQILPWFGGTAAVWTTCMVFFQSALLAGYAYADWAPRKLGISRHARVHAILALLSLATLPITVSTMWKPVDGAAPFLHIIALLAVTIGLPYFVLAATSPLVQMWFARAHPSRDPYRLFALSNTASLLALLCYPFVVEPWLALRDQTIGWSMLYAVFVLGIAALGWSVARRESVGDAFAAKTLDGTAPATVATPSSVESVESVESVRRAPASPPSFRLQLWWLLLSATASALLLAVTNHVTENIASVPMLWLMPLTIYLITFILCFDGQRWYTRETFFGPVLIAIGMMGWLLVDKSYQYDLLVESVVFGGGLFAVCMFCHGELVSSKPDPQHLGRFYTFVALGGAAGSAVVALVVPLIVPSYWETALLLVVAMALFAAVAWAWSRRGFILALAGVIVMAEVAYLHIRADTKDAIWMGRNFYGALKVRAYEAPESDNYRRNLVHGTILHGEQYLAASSRAFATTYYTGTSGVGRAIDLKERESEAIRVGMIGLGVGTIATYSREGDAFRFYEIDAQVPLIAREYFTFLDDAKGKVDIVLGDGRLSIEREEPQRYDVLAVDAFSGDAIPAHLITREAVQLFRRHLAPNGILAYHVSNRYLQLGPVLGIIAKAEGMTALQIDDFKANEGSPIKSPSVWVLMSNEAQTLETLQQYGIAPEDKPWRMWTDDYHNLFQVLRPPASLNN